MPATRKCEPCRACSSPAAEVILRPAELAAEERDRMPLERESRRAVILQHLLRQWHLRQRRERFFVVEGGQKRQVANLLLLSERLPSRRPPIERERAEHIRFRQLVITAWLNFVRRVKSSSDVNSPAARTRRISSTAACDNPAINRNPSRVAPAVARSRNPNRCVHIDRQDVHAMLRERRE